MLKVPKHEIVPIYPISLVQSKYFIKFPQKMITPPRVHKKINKIEMCELGFFSRDHVH